MSRLLDQILGISREEDLPCNDDQLYMTKRKVKIVNVKGDTFKEIDKDHAFIINESPEEYRDALRGLVKSGLAVPIVLPSDYNPEDLLERETGGQVYNSIEEVPLESLTEAMLDSENKVVVAPPITDGHVASYSALAEEEQKELDKKEAIKKKLHEIRKNRA